MFYQARVLLLFTGSHTGSHMSLHVQAEVVTPGKCSLTKMTLEGFAARVFPEMSRQFIRAGKPPVTVGPGAGVGLLPGVGSLVGLQVGRLCVHLEYEYG